MRTLLPAPDTAVDPTTHSARLGSFRGTIGRVDLKSLAPSRRYLLFHSKRWVYLAIASDDVFVGLAVVHLGYAAKLFGFVFDASSKRMLFDRSLLAPSFACVVGDTAGEGCEAKLGL
jgi:hypothetical protein